MKVISQSIRICSLVKFLCILQFYILVITSNLETIHLPRCSPVVNTLKVTTLVLCGMMGDKTFDFRKILEGDGCDIPVAHDCLAEIVNTMICSVSTKVKHPGRMKRSYPCDCVAGVCFPRDRCPQERHQVARIDLESISAACQ